MWNCPHCNESVEEPLDVCWKCGTSREGELDPEFKPADEISSPDTAELPVLAQEQRSPESPAAPGTVNWNWRWLAAAFVITLCLVLLSAWLARPKSAADFYEQGVLHLQRNQYPQAIKALTRSLELLEHEEKPFSPREAYVARAVAYNNSGDYELALVDISRAIELIPPSFSGVYISSHLMLMPAETFYLIRANILLRLERNEEAIRDLRLILEKDPENEQALKLLEFARQHQRKD
jgi:tetratricopeptide (TPR) repeat protein